MGRIPVASDHRSQLPLVVAFNEQVDEPVGGVVDAGVSEAAQPLFIAALSEQDGQFVDNVSVSEVDDGAQDLHSPVEVAVVLEQFGEFQYRVVVAYLDAPAESLFCPGTGVLRRAESSSTIELA